AGSACRTWPRGEARGGRQIDEDRGQKVSIRGARQRPAARQAIAAKSVPSVRSSPGSRDTNGLPLRVGCICPSAVPEGRAMSSLPSSHVSTRDPVADGADPSFGNALERVYGAGQELIVRRIDLLVEELAAQGRSLLAASVGTIFGAMALLV